MLNLKSLLEDSWETNKFEEQSSDWLNHVFPFANEAKKSPSSKEQMNHLLKLLNSNFSFGISSGSLVETSSNPNALSSSLNNASWIIDSNVSDYMTLLSYLFKT